MELDRSRFSSPALISSPATSRARCNLNDAVAHVGEGKLPPPLPETGPSEIASLNRGFNQMLAKLRQADEDRALLLAGVSHDLRTPLARLRLGIEVGANDASTHEGMISDIAEMDKIIGQLSNLRATTARHRWRGNSMTSSRRRSSATRRPETKSVSAAAAHALPRLDRDVAVDRQPDR
jgi:signal transduction histidine kinase